MNDAMKPVVWRRVARRVACGALLAIFCLALTEVAWAKSKKKEEVVVETKSYVLPYMIVISMVSIGVMAIARPTRRLDKPDDKHVKGKDEEE